MLTRRVFFAYELVSTGKLKRSVRGLDYIPNATVLTRGITLKGHELQMRSKNESRRTSAVLHNVCSVMRLPRQSSTVVWAFRLGAIQSIREVSAEMTSGQVDGALV